MRRDNNGNEGGGRSAPRNVLGDRLDLFDKTHDGVPLPPPLLTVALGQLICFA